MRMDMLSDDTENMAVAGQVKDPLSGASFSETQEEEILGPAAMAIQGLPSRAARVRPLKPSQRRQ